jgi:hypothetical protein
VVVHECVNDGRTEWSERVTVPVGSSGLMRLIGSVVVASHVADAADLILEFDDGQVLRVVAMGPYESYDLRLPEREIHV